MNTPTENESWLIEAGDAVIRKKAYGAALWLTSPERLIYCLWVADYSLRNAGDLAAARDLYPRFQGEGAQLAMELRLPFTQETFALCPEEFARDYFIRFERVCAEIRSP